eukprot:CAMPEP_0119272218 /NCGR_PEP_ID=MMETSP1329-20130426/8478_1 /TAXON_ID=114041 /ORGANISM="Genus nov. species nov., Strain RCC1024" /LENGTH=325 /DNA_ID=CAMNT_0007272273 /DNA_START=148 /DNA_END=1125 /DNA_ORIENTATION=-
MGQISSAPVELVRVQRRGGVHWRGAVAEMQGWRADHEDAHFSRDGGGGFSLFGVLDGHGGREAARVAARPRLPELRQRHHGVREGRREREHAPEEEPAPETNDSSASHTENTTTTSVVGLQLVPGPEAGAQRPEELERPRAVAARQRQEHGPDLPPELARRRAVSAPRALVEAAGHGAPSPFGLHDRVQEHHHRDRAREAADQRGRVARRRAAGPGPHAQRVAEQFDQARLRGEAAAHVRLLQNFVLRQIRERRPRRARELGEELHLLSRYQRRRESATQRTPRAPAELFCAEQRWLWRQRFGLKGSAFERMSPQAVGSCDTVGK